MDGLAGWIRLGSLTLALTEGAAARWRAAAPGGLWRSYPAQLTGFILS